MRRPWKSTTPSITRIYINNLNAAVEAAPSLPERPVEKLVAAVQQLPEKLRAAVINQGGGHANHSLFWEVMVPNGGGQPVGELAKAIEEQLGRPRPFQGSCSPKPR